MSILPARGLSVANHSGGDTASYHLVAHSCLKAINRLSLTPRVPRPDVTRAIAPGFDQTMRSTGRSACASGEKNRVLKVIEGEIACESRAYTASRPWLHPHAGWVSPTLYDVP